MVGIEGPNISNLRGSLVNYISAADRSTRYELSEADIGRIADEIISKLNENPDKPCSVNIRGVQYTFKWDTTTDSSGTVNYNRLNVTRRDANSGQYYGYTTPVYQMGVRNPPYSSLNNIQRGLLDYITERVPASQRRNIDYRFFTTSTGETNIVVTLKNSNNQVTGYFCGKFIEQPNSNGTRGSLMCVKYDMNNVEVQGQGYITSNAKINGRVVDEQLIISHFDRESDNFYDFSSKITHTNFNRENYGNPLYQAGNYGALSAYGSANWDYNASYDSRSTNVAGLDGTPNFIPVTYGNDGILKIPGMFYYARGNNVADAYTNGSVLTTQGNRIVNELARLYRNGLITSSQLRAMTFHASFESSTGFNKGLTEARSRAFWDALNTAIDSLGGARIDVTDTDIRESAKADIDHEEYINSQIASLSTSSAKNEAQRLMSLYRNLSPDIKDNQDQTSFINWLSQNRITPTSNSAVYNVMMNIHTQGQVQRAGHLGLNLTTDQKNAIKALLGPESLIGNAL